MYIFKLNKKILLFFFLLLFSASLGWFYVFKMITGDIGIGDEGEIMSLFEKSLFISALAIVLLSWTFSLITIIRIMIRRYAFKADINGLHNIATLRVFFALIFVVPVKFVPYSAIKNKAEVHFSSAWERVTGIKTKGKKRTALILNKKSIKMPRFMRFFVKNSFLLFDGYTIEKQGEIIEKLNSYPSFYNIEWTLLDEEEVMF